MKNTTIILRKRITAITYCTLSVMLISISGASEPATVFLPGNVPWVPTGQPSEPNLAGAGPGGMMSLRSISGQQAERGPAHHFGTLDLTHGKGDPDAPNQNTIPHWSDSFTYHGLVYRYTMVGTDPKRALPPRLSRLC